MTLRLANLLAVLLALAGCGPQLPLPSYPVAPQPAVGGPPIAVPPDLTPPGGTPAPAGVASTATVLPPAPTPTPQAQASSLPIPVESPPQQMPGKRAVASGMVYDEGGAPVDGATVRARSLEPAVPYLATCEVEEGAWLFKDVPEGIVVEFEATKAGWTTRRGNEEFQTQVVRRRGFDFGSPGAQLGNGGAGLFLSPYPEVERTEPGHGTVLSDGQQVRIKFTLSEPLDMAAQARFARAIRLWPANQAAGHSGAVDLNAYEGLDPSDGLGRHTPTFSAGQPSAAVGYAISESTTFGPDVRASVTWDEEGRTATLAFLAPLLASSAAEATFQVGLVSDGTLIQDADGFGLGTDYEGAHDLVPGADRLIANVFYARKRDYGDLDGGTRWASTHRSVVRFGLRRDEVPPRLVGVVASTVGDDLVLGLDFSEPMVAFDGTAQGRVAAGTLDLAGYTFAFGADTQAVALVDLKGSRYGEPLPLDPRTAPAGFAEVGREVVFAPGALRPDGDLAAARRGEVVIAVEARTPTTVNLTVKGRKDLIDPTMRAIKARAAYVGDPAGNVTDGAAADGAEATGSLTPPAHKG